MLYEYTKTAIVQAEISPEILLKVTKFAPAANRQPFNRMYTRRLIVIISLTYPETLGQQGTCTSMEQLQAASFLMGALWLFPFMHEMIWQWEEGACEARYFPLNQSISLSRLSRSFFFILFVIG